MTTLTEMKLTPQAYLEQEIESELKHEYRQGEVITMAGGSITHNELVRSVTVTLSLALKGKPFQVFVTDQRLWIPQSQCYYYPDVMVVSKPVALFAGRKDTLTEPILIAEVLSDSTASRDRSEKFLDYRQITTFREYLLIDQDQVYVEQYCKQSENQWLLLIWDQPHQTISLSSIDAELKLSELYENVAQLQSS